MARVYVSIGSNIDRAANVRAGVRALLGRYGDVRLSSVYDTPAVGFSGDDFYNLVAGFDTAEDVHGVAAFLREAEARSGRVRVGTGMVSRTLDMDLLLYDDLVMHEGPLRLPREEILEYAFVLAPLAEIAGAERHPVLGRSYAELWADLGRDGRPLAVVDFDWEAP